VAIGPTVDIGFLQHSFPLGEWTTYDKNGKVYKVTRIKPKAK
jgi:hypothetical protein